MFDALIERHFAAEQTLANDQVIGPVFSTISGFTKTEDSLVGRADSEAQSIELQAQRHDALERIWESLIPDEPIVNTNESNTGSRDFEFSCSCTMEEIEANAPETLVDYLLYCHLL